MSEALVPVAAVDRPETARPGAAAVALPEVIVDAGPAGRRCCGARPAGANPPLGGHSRESWEGGGVPRSQ